MKKLFWIALLPTLALLSGCNDMFGRKTKLDFITPPQSAGDEVSYVPVFPYITNGMQYPTAVIAGNDNLLYVVDSAAQQLICYDEAGREQSRMTVPGIRAVAQDRTLDILALGKDRIVGAEASDLRQVPTIFRISVKLGRYGLGEDKIVRRIQQPFLLGRTAVTTLDTAADFNGIAVLSDNQYYVTRSGEGADPISQVPYSSVLLFDNRDRFKTTLSVAGEGGAVYSDFFRNPGAIATLPPRSLVIPNADPLDFLISTFDQSEVLPVRYISVSQGDAGFSYNVKLMAPDLYAPGRFVRPQGLTFATDATGFIFLTDKDSLFQFDAQGSEGIQLRTSQGLQLRKVSFGGTGNGPFQFNRARGVAYLNQIVYVADAGNRRVCRFKLSSDFR